MFLEQHILKDHVTVISDAENSALITEINYISQYITMENSI